VIGRLKQAYCYKYGHWLNIPSSVVDIANPKVRQLMALRCHLRFGAATILAGA
jgi:hypothetical protein